VIQVLSQIKVVSDQLATAHSSVYSGEAVVRLVTSLAEGADLLVASVAQNLGFGIEVVLPYGQPEFSKEIHSPLAQTDYKNVLNVAERTGAVLELDGEPGTAEAYWTAGLTVLRHSDVLIAIWDGEAAEMKGGTAEVVAQAAGSGIPIVWIDPNRPGDVCLADVRAGRAERGPGLDSLPEHLRRLVQPPDAVSQPQSRRALKEYFGRETARRCRLGGGFDFITRLLAGQWPFRSSLLPRDFAAAIERSWKNAATIPAMIVPALEAKLLRSFAWADHLATYYATRYRDSATYILFLAPLAVLAAVVEHLSQASASRDDFGSTTVALGALELTILLAVVIMYVWGRVRRFHERWIDYRLVAERLRHLLFQRPIGYSLRVAPFARARGDKEHRLEWVNWYVRAIQREAGLISGAMNSDYLREYATWLGRMITSQALYHQENATRMGRVHRILHALAFGTFALAVVLTALHVGPEILGVTSAMPERYWRGGQALVLATALPLLGGAIHGFLVQGEFEATAKRSERIAEELGIQAHNLGATVFAWTSVAEAADRAVETMGAELSDWHFVFRAKPLPPPS